MAVATHCSDSFAMPSLPSIADLDLLATKYPNVFAAVLIGTILLLMLLRVRYVRTRPRVRPPSLIPSFLSSLTLYQALKGFEALGKVTPLTDFDYTKEAPRKWRPFKKIYNLTMALEKATLDDLITIDRNHPDRILERRRLHGVLERKATDILHHDHPCYSAAEQGTQELYDSITSYLPVRYPTIYRKVQGMFWWPEYLHTSLTCPASAFNDFSKAHNENNIPMKCPEDVRQGLLNISSTLDEDFLVLVPAEDGDGYILASYITCFPQGFETSTLLGKRVREIHGPVPKYKEKLQSSMERFFDRMEVGKFVRRANWSCATTNKLYTGDVQTHFHAGEEREEEDIRPEQCLLRTEAQILFRLPKTRALVFVIKTYTYPLEDIKAEGLGPDLADAIEGLEKGNVPEIFTYKRGPVWAEKVKAYLRN